VANARPDSATTQADMPVVIDVLANDGGGSLTIVGITSPGNGTAAVNGDQTVTYTPSTGFVGVDDFTYTIRGRGNATSSAAITVTVLAANRAPVASDVEAITSEGTAVVVDLLANAHDPDGDPLAVVGLSQPANGSVALNGDQTVTYAPGAGFVGIDGFSYTIADPHGATDSATVTVTVLEATGEPWKDGTLWGDNTGWGA
jgi:hypothetical protein